MRVGTLDIGMIAGKSRSLSDMMQRGKVATFCFVQETKLNGSKARSFEQFSKCGSGEHLLPKEGRTQGDTSEWRHEHTGVWSFVF